MVFMRSHYVEVNQVAYEAGGWKAVVSWDDLGFMVCWEVGHKLAFG